MTICCVSLCNQLLLTHTLDLLCSPDFGRASEVSLKTMQHSTGPRQIASFRVFKRETHAGPLILACWVHTRWIRDATAGEFSRRWTFLCTTKSVIRWSFRHIAHDWDSRVAGLFSKWGAYVKIPLYFPKENLWKIQCDIPCLCNNNDMY